MLKAVIFDLDQTLLNRDATFVAFMKIQYRRYSHLMRGVTEEAYVSALRKFDSNGYSEKDRMFASACELLGIPHEAERLVNDFKTTYGSAPVPFEDSLPTLDRLRGRYRLGMVTNGRTYAQNEKITHSGLRPYFEDIRVSETEGVEKPDPRIFFRCVEALGILPSEAVYVGDHAQNDVEAAMVAGLRGIWKRSRHYEPPNPCDAIIEHLNELPEVLERI